MRRQVNLRNLLWISVILMLVMVPLRAAQGQDVTDGSGTDVTQDTAASEGTVDQGEPEAATEDGALSQGPALQAYQLYLPSIAGGDAPADQIDAAFQHGWTAEACVNVVNNSTNRGLWDDMPGPGGANNEAGLLWFVTNDGLNEQCSYYSLIGGLGALANRLQFRVAVNDNALYYVTLYRRSGTFCLPYLSRSTTTTSDDSQFRTYLFTFTTAPICRVRLLLTDDPNTFNAAVDRTSALIDYVRLWNGTALTWQEQFTN